MYLFQSYFNYNVSFLLFISFTSLLLGLSIIVTKNPILSVLFLIGLFISIAIYLILLGLNFIGLSYLLVYVGAISILFLFILMLINIRISELLTEGRNSIPLAILTVLFFNYGVNPILPYNSYITDISININDKLNSVYNYFTIDNDYTHLFKTLTTFLSDSIGMVKSSGWDGLLVGVTHISVIGNLLYAAFYIFLVIISLILLLAMVGAIIITINKSNIKNIPNSSSSFLDVKNIQTNLYNSSSNISDKITK